VSDPSEQTFAVNPTLDHLAVALFAHRTAGPRRLHLRHRPQGALPLRPPPAGGEALRSSFLMVAMRGRRSIMDSRGATARTDTAAVNLEGVDRANGYLAADASGCALWAALAHSPSLAALDCGVLTASATTKLLGATAHPAWAKETATAVRLSASQKPSLRWRRAAFFCS